MASGFIDSTFSSVIAYTSNMLFQWRHKRRTKLSKQLLSLIYSTAFRWESAGKYSNHFGFARNAGASLYQNNEQMCRRATFTHFPLELKSLNASISFAKSYSSIKLLENWVFGKFRITMSKTSNLLTTEKEIIKITSKLFGECPPARVHNGSDQVLCLVRTKQIKIYCVWKNIIPRQQNLVRNLIETL